ncbi:MAG: isoprenylcysteine carboxylmethyltransferase family protein [Candidatus Eiseniibacteriota bacterium]|nr:MAG: isoprenylcysteine carboxylmethyltransferase family protein [Candidatus Eisenbacteria bacterium]
MASAARMKEKNGEHPLGDSGQLVLLGLFLSVWAADSFFLRKSTFLSHHIPLLLRLIVLAGVLVLAFFLYRSGHAVVSHGARPAGLVSTDAFKYVRHPLYLASMLFYVGLAVSTASLLSLALVAVAFTFYDYIARYEERLLVAKLGKAYEDYMERTGRWIPRVRTRERTETRV